MPSTERRATGLGGVPAPATKVAQPNGGSVVTVVGPGVTAHHTTTKKAKSGSVKRLTPKQAKILGIVIAVVVGAILLGVLFVWLRRKRRAHKNAKMYVDDPTPIVIPAASDKGDEEEAGATACSGPYPPGRSGSFEATILPYANDTTAADTAEREREERMIALETAQARENEARGREARMAATAQTDFQPAHDHDRLIYSGGAALYPVPRNAVVDSNSDAQANSNANKQPMYIDGEPLHLVNHNTVVGTTLPAPTGAIAEWQPPSLATAESKRDNALMQAGHSDRPLLESEKGPAK